MTIGGSLTSAVTSKLLYAQLGGLDPSLLPQGLVSLLSTTFQPWLRECDSWAVFTIASVTLYWYARNCRPGPSFTYAWLWVGVLSTLSQNVDANALFYLIGFGLITGWYTTQILQRDVWDRLLVYWLKMWPPWCVSTAVRFGDLAIHILPFAYSLRFYQHVALHHVFQAILYERIYFYAIENSFIGSGEVANEIYALHPPCGPHVFRSIQMLSTVGYFFASTVCADTGRQFLQALWLSLYLFIAFGTAGFFDLTAMRLPTDKESFLTLLADWEDVNGKVANYIQSLREVVAQSLTSPTSDFTVLIPENVLTFLLAASKEGPSADLNEKVNSDGKQLNQETSFTSTLNEDAWLSPRKGDFETPRRQTPQRKQYTMKDSFKKTPSTSSSYHREINSSQRHRWSKATTDSPPSVQSLTKRINSLEDIVSELKMSYHDQREDLRRLSAWQQQRQLRCRRLIRKRKGMPGEAASEVSTRPSSNQTDYSVRNRVNVSTVHRTEANGVVD